MKKKVKRPQNGREDMGTLTAEQDYLRCKIHTTIQDMTLVPLECLSETTCLPRISSFQRSRLDQKPSLEGLK